MKLSETLEWWRRWSVEKYFPNDFDSESEVVNLELPKYKNSEAMFGKQLAVVGRRKNEVTSDSGKYFQAKVLLP